MKPHNHSESGAISSEIEEILDRPAGVAGKLPVQRGRAAHGSGHEIRLREPAAVDGSAITRLVAACAPLDTNSAYCNLLQCTHFAETCIVAEHDGQVVGWVSGYRPPSEPDSFFVWQVAVSQAARGQGLAQRMINALLDRPSAQGATHLTTTVTDDNAPSWALFSGLARAWHAPLVKSAMFERDAHFAGAHATEWLARIGPLSRRETPNPNQEN